MKSRIPPVVSRKRTSPFASQSMRRRLTSDFETLHPIKDFTDNDFLFINLENGNFSNHGVLATTAFTSEVFWEYRYRIITYPARLGELHKLDIEELDPNDPPYGAVEWELIFVVPKRSRLSSQNRELIQGIHKHFVDEAGVITLLSECRIYPRSYKQIKPHIDAGNVLDDQYHDLKFGDEYNITYFFDINKDLNAQILLAPRLTSYI